MGSVCTMSDIIERIKHIIPRESKYNIDDLLIKHKCFYLVYLNNNASVPAFLNKRIAIEALAVKERYNSSKEILDNLGCKYAIIKGAVLSKRIYNNIAYRPSGDIDILVNPNNLTLITSLMNKLGFVQGTLSKNEIRLYSREEILFQTIFTHQAPQFVKKTNNFICPFVCLDFNTDLLWGEHVASLNMDTVLNYTESDEICGIAIKRLQPCMEFIALCLHHYKDMNSIFLLIHNSLKLNLFCDIYFYMKTIINDQCKVLSLAKKMGVDKYVYYCIYYTHLVFADDMTNEWLSTFLLSRDDTLMDSFGLSDNERKKWSIGFFERLFNEDLSLYLRGEISTSDVEKINKNNLYMR